jgi:putative Ca2+/H+ antiporter (TMEM165/GDT1 family)
LSAFVSKYTPVLLSILFFVFALTMAGDDKRDDQPQATKTKLDTIVSHLDAMKTLMTSL